MIKGFVTDVGILAMLDICFAKMNYTLLCVCVCVCVCVLVVIVVVVFAVCNVYVTKTMLSKSWKVTAAEMVTVVLLFISFYYWFPGRQ